MQSSGAEFIVPGRGLLILHAVAIAAFKLVPIFSIPLISGPAGLHTHGVDTQWKN
jgi:hypothetical protein